MPDAYDDLLDSVLPKTRASNYDEIINRHAQRTGLDPALIKGVMSQESSANPRARSPKGAAGLMQLMPGTAKRFGVSNPNDPEQSIRGGTDYLRFLTNRYKGNIDKVLAGYNAGEGNVDKYGGVPPFRETRNYVPQVKARIQKLGGQVSEPAKRDAYDDLLDEVIPKKADEYDTLVDSVTAPAVQPSPRSKRSPFAGIRAGVGASEERSRIQVPDINQILTQARTQGRRNVPIPQRTPEETPEAIRDQIRQQVIAERDQAKQSTSARYGSMVGAPGVGTLAGGLKTVENVMSPVQTVRNLFKSDKDQVEEEVNKRYEAHLRSQTPEMTAQRKEFGAAGAPVRSITAPVARLAGGLEKSLGTLTSGLGIRPNRLSKYLNQRGQLIEEASSLPPLSEMGIEIQRELPEKFVSALGDLGLGVGQIIALKKAAPGLSLSQILGIETALKTGDLPLAERADRVAQSVLMGKVLDQHLSKPVSAAVFGVPTAVESGGQVLKGNMTLEDAILNTAVQTGAGAILGGKRARTTETQRQGVSQEQPAEAIQPERVDVGVSPRAVVDRGNVEAVPDITRTQAQRFYHKDWGEVIELPDQVGARRGRVKVAEVDNPEAIHYPKRADLSGKGNQRLVPVRPAEPAAEAVPTVSSETLPTAATTLSNATTAPSSSIPTSAKLFGEEVSPSEAVRNSYSTNAKNLANIVETPAFRNQGLSGLDIPTQRAVLSGMFSAIHDPEIRDGVVKFVPVKVVNDLILAKSPTDVSLHDKSVLQDLSTVDSKGAVSLRSDVADTLIRAVARSSTETTRIPSDLPLRAQEGKAALEASNREHGASIAQKAQESTALPATASMPSVEELAQKGETTIAPDQEVIGAKNQIGPSTEAAGGGQSEEIPPAPSTKPRPGSPEAEKFGPGAASVKEPIPEVKERKFGTRFVEDERIVKELRDSIGTAKYYEVAPNKITAEQAKTYVDKNGLGETWNAVRDESNGIPFHVRSVMGQGVILRLNRAYTSLKETNPKAAEYALDRATDMAEWQMDYGTRLGQGVQSFAMWAKLSPEGKLLTYKRAVDKARQRVSPETRDEVKEIVDTINESMTHGERVDHLKKLFATNKTARKVRSQIDKLIEAAKDGKLTDTLFYDVVGDRLGLPKYNKEIANEITKRARAIEDAPEGMPRDQKVFELNKYIAEQKGFGASDLPIGIYYGNILSGYNTHIVNTVDTAFNVISEINGLAMTNPRAAAKIYGGLLRGFADGKLDAISALTKGRMVTDGKWLEVPRLMEIARFGEKGGVPISTATRAGRLTKRVAETPVAYPLNAYKYVTRLLAASDAVFFRSAKEARASLLAYRMAEAEGLKDDALDAKIRDILALDKRADFLKQAEREGFTGLEAQTRAAELTDMIRDKDITSDAAEFAGEATYNHEPHGALGYASKVVGDWAQKYKALKLFVPFTRIVANVTNRGLNYTPYGYKRAFMGYSHGEALTPEGRTLMITRATVGSVGLVALGAMQEAGLIQIHGAGPSDKERKRQLQNAGWRPYSIQIGNTYISYVYTPVGLGLSIVGNMTDSQRYHEMEQKDAATRGAYAVARLGSTVFSQSFLSGLSRLFNALSESPNESVTAVKQTLSSTVSAATTPNLARDIYRLFDNKTYQSNTLMEDLVRNTPFAGLALKPTLNAFGEPVRVQRQRFFDVMTSDPAWKFVTEKGLRVPLPSKSTEMEKGTRITPEQYYQLLSKTGPQVKTWIIANRARLARMKEDDAQDELQQAATRIRKMELTRMRLLTRRKAA